VYTSIFARLSALAPNHLWLLVQSGLRHARAIGDMCPRTCDASALRAVTNVGSLCAAGLTSSTASTVLAERADSGTAVLAVSGVKSGECSAGGVTTRIPDND
jgi:hypothetical protein